MAPKQRQIKNFGYAEDYENQEAFWKMVEEEERKFKESKENIEVKLDSSLTLKDARRYELGYKYLDAVYDFFEIDKFLETLKVKADYDYKKYSDTLLQKEFFMLTPFGHVSRNQKADMDMNE